MRKGAKFLVIALGIAVVSCAVITVNIYFPEKDVKEAYQLLEKELMGTEQKPQETLPRGKPESFLNFELVPFAFAQEAGLPSKIAEIVKKMPDVVNAYREMGARLAEIDRLRESGAVGEGKNGLLTVREGSLSPADQKLVNQENENRATVMRGMARAIVRINRLPENDANMNQVMPQAVDQFAAIRRDAAKKGWWIQDANGNWSRK